jgi:hypothetical protein
VFVPKLPFSGFGGALFDGACRGHRRCAVRTRLTPVPISTTSPAPSESGTMFGFVGIR